MPPHPQHPGFEFLPVVMITASGDQEKVRAIEAGADDFVSKPLNQGELLARVASLARVKRYQDTIERQSAELAQWNTELEARVQAQVDELQRVNRLRRFLSPQLVDLVIDSGDEGFLVQPPARDRRASSATCAASPLSPSRASPKRSWACSPEYHRALGELIYRFEGTLERFTGDGLMVFFNDPLPVDDAAERAVTMAVAMRDRVAELAAGWHRRGHDLGFGIGIAQGFATLGRIGFEGRFDYAAIGSVTNLAARLCGEAASGQVLVAQRVFSATEGLAIGEPVGDLDLRGFSRPIRVFDVTGIDESKVKVIP